MINIFSLNCGLAFAPYLVDGLASFIDTGETSPRVVRQAANGFIIRSEGGLRFRHENCEAVLTREDGDHFLATIKFRQEVYDVLRQSDEVVMASVGNQVLLSHPQSELWLAAQTIPSLLEAFHRVDQISRENLPEWLTLSGGDGRLLLSDQRSGRWVLLGSDHYAELERRVVLLKRERGDERPAKPPTITVKSAKVALQAAIKLERTLETYATTREFTPYEEITPSYQLMVMRAIEGMKISDGTLSIAITQKESSKWAAILQAEIEKYRLQQMERGNLRTVIAKVENGAWLLQWGDEVLVSEAEVSDLLFRKSPANPDDRLAGKQERSFLLLLDKASGGCVALIDDEVRSLKACLADGL